MDAFPTPFTPYLNKTFLFDENALKGLMDIEKI